MRAAGVLMVGVVVACTLGVGFGPAPIWAQQTPGATPNGNDMRARELWMRGNQLFEEGQYEAALAAFEESYRLSERHGTLVALANTYELLGRFEEAVAMLRRYEPHARADEVEVIRNRISSLERRLEQRSTSPEPQPKSDPKPDPDSAGGATGGTSGQGVQSSGAMSGQVSEPRVTAPRQPERPLGAWIVTGTGGAVVAAGLGLGLAAVVTRSDIDERCGSYQDQTFCPVDASSLIDRHRRLALSADIALGVGLATTAAGVVWLLLGGDNAETQPAISISPGLQEVRLVVRF